MQVKLINKKQTQEILTQLRQLDYEVVKTSTGSYEVKLDGVLIFQALIGHYAYLVRFDPRLFPEA